MLAVAPHEPARLPEIAKSGFDERDTCCQSPSDVQHVTWHDTDWKCRTTGGDKVEAFLTGPGDAVLPVAVKDLGNGCYMLSSTATRPGAWTLKPRVSADAQLPCGVCPVT